MDDYDYDEEVGATTSNKPTPSKLDVAEEPEDESQEVEAAERNFEGEDKNSEDERDEEEAEAKLLKQEEGVDLKDFENTSSDLKNQFILHLCYKNVRMEHHNLLDQCGARDYILFDIDALLEHLLSEKNFVDWSDHGGQFLHLTYCLERFVQNMLDRTMKFDIVSFENAGRVSCSVTEELQSRADFTSFKRYNVTVSNKETNNQYVLARLAVLRHLETKLGVKIHRFTHWLDDDWKQFLIQSRPAFVVAEADAFLFLYHCFLLNNVPIVCDIYFKGLSSYGFSSELYVELPSQVMAILPEVLRSYEGVYRKVAEQAATLDVTKAAELQQKDQLFTLDGNKVALSAVACCNLLQSSSEDDLFINLHLSQLLIATQLLQTQLPLAYRSQLLNYKYPAVNTFLEQFYGELVKLINVQSESADLHDIIDGRLLHTLLNIQSEKLNEVGAPEEFDIIFQLPLPEQILSAYQAAQQFIQASGAPQTSNLACPPDHWKRLAEREDIALPEVSVQEVEEDSEQITVNKLLPVHNPLVDEYLSDVKIPENRGAYFEDQHEPSRDAISQWSARDNFEVKLSQKQIQRRKDMQDASLKRLHDYAESLGKLNLKRAIETERSEAIVETEEDTTSGKKGKPVKPKKEAKKPKSSKSAETIILKNSISKNSSELDSVLKQFKPLAETKITSSNVRATIRALEDHVKAVTVILHSSFKIQEMIPEPAPTTGKKKAAAKPSAEADSIAKLIKKLEDTLIDLFSFELKTNLVVAEQTKSDEDYYRVLESVNFIYDYLNELKKKRSSETFGDIYKFLATSLHQAGFRALAKQMVDIHPESKAILSFTDPVNERDPNVLQLRFNISFRSVVQFFPEEKVEYDMSDLDSKSRKIKEKMIDLGFRPDPWQLELIDHVDHNRSVLCAAPTSSGKTFIALYVIEKILRESDDAVVVFCLPTKALVNQVFAEIYSRFTKKYAHPESRQMLGMFTGNDRINITSAQVLITIPQCLEVMMFSHTREHIEWRERLNYVILDEIHCMNSDSGDLWEHILLMIKCPFLALSATIGNPEAFTSWLRTNKQNVELVQYKDRPQPLEFEIFQPTIEEKPKMLASIHPCAVLNPYKIVDVEIDRMPTFSASECLSFYTVAQSTCERMGVENIFEVCSPSKLTQNFGLVNRSTLLEYRKLVTSTVQEIARSGKHDELLLEVFAQLRSNIDSAYSLINTHYSKKEFDSQYFLKKHFAECILELKERGQLPTICFYFSRFFIDKLMETLLDYVKENRINLWETDRDRANALLQINSVVDDIAPHVDEIFIEALRYGISVHYNAMHENYQKAVERLLRQRTLPVVIATTTLALGIHIPARSVVLLGKSKYLDTTLFYQCAGRAGRRGFDTLGRVCLIGLDQASVNRYMTSAPPSIMGSMGLKPTFLLRMLISYSETLKNFSEKEEFMRTDYLRVLQQPLFVLGQIRPQSQLQVKHYFRYSVEFLRRNGYVDKDGAPLNYAGFASRLHYNEPYNFLFLFFAQYDRLHDLVRDEEIAYEKRLEQLLGVLAFFFGRQRIFKHDVMCKILPPMSGSMKHAHSQYSDMVKQIYSDYVKQYCSSHIQENEDTALPMSGIKYKFVPSEVKFVPEEVEPEETKVEEVRDEDLQWDENDEDLQWDENEVEEKEPEQKEEEVQETKEPEPEQEPEEDLGIIVNILKAQRQQNHSTSSFAALSGNHDNYISIEHLLATVKHTLIIDPSVIPTQDISSEMLNSYAVEFFSHGNLSRLCKENSFHSAVAAKTLLSEVNNDLRNLRNALDTMKIPEDDILLKAIRELSYEFQKRFTGYEFRRKRSTLRNIRVEASDLDKYGKKATRQDKQYGDKRENMDALPKKAKEEKVQKRSKHFS